MILKHLSNGKQKRGKMQTAMLLLLTLRKVASGKVPTSSGQTALGLFAICEAVRVESGVSSLMKIEEQLSGYGTRSEKRWLLGTRCEAAIMSKLALRSTISRCIAPK